MKKEPVIFDATKVEDHAMKHQMIFAKFNSLEDGESFILHNDHDPVPVYYQLTSMHGKDAISWDYEERGPAVYEVKITRHLNS